MAKDKSEKKKVEVEDVEMADAQVRSSCLASLYFSLTSRITIFFQSPTKSSKKDKKEKEEKEEVVVNLEDLSPIAHPLAQKKLLKKLHKTIKKGALSSCLYYAYMRSIDWMCFCSIESAPGEARSEGGSEGHP